MEVSKFLAMMIGCLTAGVLSVAGCSDDDSRGKSDGGSENDGTSSPSELAESFEDLCDWAVGCTNCAVDRETACAAYETIRESFADADARCRQDLITYYDCVSNSACDGSAVMGCQTAQTNFQESCTEIDPTGSGSDALDSGDDNGSAGTSDLRQSEAAACDQSKTCYPEGSSSGESNCMLLERFANAAEKQGGACERATKSYFDCTARTECDDFQSVCGLKILGVSNACNEDDG